MLIFPDISPNLIDINVWGIHLAVRWYSLSYLVGFFLAYTSMRFAVAKNDYWTHNLPPIEKHEVSDLIYALMLGVIIGGRLGYVAFYNLDYFLANPFRILAIWEGGMSFHGGFLGVVVAGLYFVRQRQLRTLSIADLIALSTPPGLFLGRLANFINAELWGRPTSVPWGVSFPGEDAQNCPLVSGACFRHPSQIYEAILEGLLLFAVLWIFANRGLLRSPGSVTGIFLTGYGSARFIVEFYRVADQQFITPDNPNGAVLSILGYGLSAGQTLSVPMIFVGLIMVFLCMYPKKSGLL